MARRSDAYERVQAYRAGRERDWQDPDYVGTEDIYGVSPSTSKAAWSFLSRNPKNKGVGAAAADFEYNSLTAAAQRESDAKYFDEMSPRALKFYGENQKIATEATEREIAAQTQSGVTLEGARRQTNLAQIQETGKQALGNEIALRDHARKSIRETGRGLYG